MKITGVTVMALEWSCIGITFFLLLFRLFIRLRFRRLSYSDMFVLLAWLVFLNTACMDTGLFVTGYLAEYNGGPPIESDKELEFAFKLLFAENTSYQLCMYFVKASMLCFYAEFVTRHLIFKTWVVLCFTGLLVFIGGMWSPLFHLLWCRPLSVNWDPNTSSTCSLADSRWIIYTNLALHVGTDLLILLIPLLVLHSLRALPLKQKIGAGLMFLLGVLSILGAIGTFYSFYVAYWTTGEQTLRAFVYVTIEETTSVTVACFPAFRLLWVRSERLGSSSEAGLGSSAWNSNSRLGGSVSEQGGSRLVSSSHSNMKMKGLGGGMSPSLQQHVEEDEGMYLSPLRDEGGLLKNYHPPHRDGRPF